MIPIPVLILYGIVAFIAGVIWLIDDEVEYRRTVRERAEYREEVFRQMVEKAQKR